MKFRKRDTLFIFIILFASILPLLAGLFYHKFVSTRKQIRTDEMHALLLQKQALSNELQVTWDDIELLAGQARQLLTTTESPYTAPFHLELFFQVFLNSRPEKYRSIRWYNTDGIPPRLPNQERGRSLRRITNQWVVPDTNFVLIADMDKQEVTLGASSVKSQVLLQKAVYRNDRSLLGKLVIEIHPETLTTIFSIYQQKAKGQHILLNKDGLLLGNVAQIHNLAAVLDKIRSGSDSAWETLLMHDSGQLHTPSGLLSYTTLCPYQPDSAESAIASNQATGNNQPMWKLLSILPAKQVRELFRPVFIECMSITLIVVLITTVAALILSGAREKRRRAEQALQYSLQELEELVQERTEELSVTRFVAEESEQLKTAFLQNISHEIRTPMNGIVGFTNLLKRPELGLKERLWYISIIERSGERMLATIDDLITISLLDSRQVVPYLSAGNLEDKLRETYELFRYEMQDKNIDFQCINPLTTELHNVFTDHDKVGIILRKLVQNAVKFTDTGHVYFGISLTQDSLHFYVEDTGKGIGPENMDTIFESFRQTDITLTKNCEGAGLGLSIAKGYTELLGGRIWVDSHLGEGSVFHFTIPYTTKTGNPLQNRSTHQIQEK